MLMRIFVVIIIIIAIAVGLATHIAHDTFFNTAALHDFFNATLPVLGFGALVKYLCKCRCSSCNK